ncbi:hypothetical protein BpHYR1_001566 [Brachionus plicatilis]|uniref:Uncharacterized protein n=1 Tax=Brachionus plicatilis TaxID=10195 RepID=A0A3M7QAJ7_BRAPC|nr:hypothetical protein BpHYR1_001566 [Brachionus plicatilis]
MANKKLVSLQHNGDATKRTTEESLQHYEKSFKTFKHLLKRYFTLERPNFLRTKYIRTGTDQNFEKIIHDQRIHFEEFMTKFMIHSEEFKF